ncbi:putative phenylphosphate carboxylase, gamma subunit [delta proteobacterium NaphS2]|nr:putative phenylphosphate carboxylase, gamma subunit [delta proteobacterium NaphS2]
MGEYLFIDVGKEELNEGESVITVKDMNPGKKLYKSILVKAQTSSDPKSLPGADVLRVRGPLGHLRPQVWAIKILENLPVY